MMVYMTQIKIKKIQTMIVMLMMYPDNYPANNYPDYRNPEEEENPKLTAIQLV